MPARRPGGRSARVRRDVLAATVDLLAERGIAGLTVEAIATRAGVNKTTIYRWWPSPIAVAVDAVGGVLEFAIPIPDTGSLRGDLRRVIHDAHVFVTSPLGMAVVYVGLGAPDTPEIVTSVQTVWRNRFSLLNDIVRRAVNRGELPPSTDSQLLLEQLIAPLYFRLFILRSKVTRPYLDHVVDHLIAGATDATRTHRPTP